VGQQVPEGLHATNQTERGIVRHKRDGRYAPRSYGSAGSRRASRYQLNRELKKGMVVVHHKAVVQQVSKGLHPTNQTESDHQA
jgi:hypothetical protein